MHQAKCRPSLKEIQPILEFQIGEKKLLSKRIYQLRLEPILPKKYLNIFNRQKYRTASK